MSAKRRRVHAQQVVEKASKRLEEIEKLLVQIAEDRRIESEKASPKHGVFINLGRKERRLLSERSELHAAIKQHHLATAPSRSKQGSRHTHKVGARARVATTS